MHKRAIEIFRPASGGGVAVVLALALLATQHAAAGVTSLDMLSDVGESIGEGRAYHYTADDGTFTVEHYELDNVIIVHFRSSDGSHWFDLSFASPDGQPLAVGFYPGARRYPFQGGGSPGLSVSGDGRGCGSLTGDFQIKEIAYDVDGRPVAFRASFGQHCAGAMPGLNGEIRYNADVTTAARGPASEYVERGHPLVFDIVAEDLDGLPVTLAARSLPEGATLVDNGDDTATFRWTPTRFGSYTVEIEADNGAGGHDLSITSISVVGTTSLVMDGRWDGTSHHFHYVPSDGYFRVTRNFASGVYIIFNSYPQAAYWHLEFAGPYSLPLQVGSYPDAARFPFQEPDQPGMDVGGGCNTIAGDFEVEQISFDDAGGVESLRVSFAQLCVDSGATLEGEFRFNADVPVVVTAPLAGSVEETDTISFDVTALDVEGYPVTLTAVDLPEGASFVDHGDGKGIFRWTPDTGQAGEHVVKFRGDDTAGETDQASTVITVSRLNRPPVAVPGGPYEGEIGSPVDFDASVSYDPDGDPIFFFWDFGDGVWGSGAQPTHTYQTGGSFQVVLYASDTLLFSAVATVANIRPKSGPDLSGSWHGVQLLNLSRDNRGGCLLHGLVRIINQGDQDASQSRLGVYSSDDRSLDATDDLVATTAVGVVPAFTARDSVVAAHTGCRDVEGRFLIGIVDATTLVPEIDETNNITIFGPIQVSNARSAPGQVHHK